MKRILVADDSVTIQKVISLTFADEPFEVQSVGTGSEALEIAKNWKPDILLADVIMPQMNGYELCKAVKQQEETSSIPVLLLAGTFEAFDEDEAKSAGADGFITKPFESGELIDKVRTLIGDMPSAPPVEAAQMEEKAPLPADPPITSETSAPAEAPIPAPQMESSEPDIWDILSESGGDEKTASDAPSPGLGPIEDSGVVDVGSFDVGVGKPESQPVPPPEPPTEPDPDPSLIEAVQDMPEPAAVPEPEAPGIQPQPEGQPQDIDEKSRVENMEKDFFGFETDAVEEATSPGAIDDAVEEVTFEMEQPPQAESELNEASFVVPEPAGDQPAVTGETISPHIMAPEPPPGIELDPVPAPEPEPETAPASDPMTTFEPEPAPVPPAAPAPEPAPEAPPVPEPATAFEPEPAPVVSQAEPMLEAPPEPVPEPPLELPAVDLATDLPEEFSPEPAQEAVTETPADLAPEPILDVPLETTAEVHQEPPAQKSVQVPDEEAIRKMVEEKVEKIVWEVVPEMAEVIIREAIQKIKDGK